MLALAECLERGRRVVDNAFRLDRAMAGLGRDWLADSAAAITGTRRLPVAGGDITIGFPVERIGEVRFDCSVRLGLGVGVRANGVGIGLDGPKAGAVAGVHADALGQPGARDPIMRRIQAVRVGGIRVIDSLSLVLIGKIKAVEVEALIAIGGRLFGGCIGVWK